MDLSRYLTERITSTLFKIDYLQPFSRSMCVHNYLINKAFVEIALRSQEGEFC